MSGSCPDSGWALKSFLVILSAVHGQVILLSPPNGDITKQIAYWEPLTMTSWGRFTFASTCCPVSDIRRACKQGHLN